MMETLEKIDSFLGWPPLWIGFGAGGGVLLVMYLQVELTMDVALVPRLRLLGSGVLLILISFAMLWEPSSIQRRDEDA